MYEHDPVVVVVVAGLLGNTSGDLCLRALIVQSHTRPQGHDPVSRNDLSSYLTLTLTLSLSSTLTVSSNWYNLNSWGHLPSPGNV